MTGSLTLTPQRNLGYVHTLERWKVTPGESLSPSYQEEKAPQRLLHLWPRSPSVVGRADGVWALSQPPTSEGNSSAFYKKLPGFAIKRHIVIPECHTGLPHGACPPYSSAISQRSRPAGSLGAPGSALPAVTHGHELPQRNEAGRGTVACLGQTASPREGFKLTILERVAAPRAWGQVAQHGAGFHLRKGSWKPTGS